MKREEEVGRAGGEQLEQMVLRSDNGASGSDSWGAEGTERTLDSRDASLQGHLERRI